MNTELLVRQVVEGLGFELVAFETTPRARLLRVFIDIERGITVDDCADVSHQLTRVFEVEGVDYDRLEVSSPGLDRPLVKETDFVRFVDSQAQIRMQMPIDNQRNFVGVLQGVSDGAVILQTAQGVKHLPLGAIEKARLVPRF